MSLASFRTLSVRRSTSLIARRGQTVSPAAAPLVVVEIGDLDGWRRRYSTMPTISLPTSSPWALSSSLTTVGRNSLPTIRSFHVTSRSCKKGEDGDDETPESGRDDLLNILKREHDEETMNENSQMPKELKVLQNLVTKDYGWKIVQEENAALVRLVRTDATLNLKVQVSFHCQDLIENEREEEYEKEQQGDDEEEELAMPVRFTVVASKAGHSFVFGCMSADGVAQIQSVAVTSSDDETSLANNGSVPAKEYQGPEFFELAEDLQASFQDFLELDLGINEDVATFISMYADYQEQTSYVSFLERAQKILS